jgi:hypothetical protein
MTIHWLARKSANSLRPDVKEVKIERRKLAVKRRPDIARTDRMLFWKKVLALLVLVPLSLFTLMVCVDLFFHRQVQGSLWTSAEWQWFIGGVALWLLFFIPCHRLFSIFYVFGHEWTHIFAARLCGGVIYDYHVGRDGGWVETNKSNTFISLSPYLIPFYTFFAVLGFAAIGMFLNLDAPLPIGTLRLFESFTLMKGLYFTVGLTWCFHLSYTLRTLRVQQTDVLRNGEFFSMQLIFLVNLALVAFFLLIASPTVGWPDACNSVWNTGSKAIHGTLATVSAATGALQDEALSMKQDLDHWKVR